MRRDNNNTAIKPGRSDWFLPMMLPTGAWWCHDFWRGRSEKPTEDLQELWSVQIYCISAGLFHVWYYLVNRQKKSSRAWSRSRYITFTWGPVLTRSFCDLRMFCVHVAHRPAGECLIPADTLSHLQVDFRRAAQTGEGSPASDIIDYSEIKSPSWLLSHFMPFLSNWSF